MEIDLEILDMLRISATKTERYSRLDLSLIQQQVSLKKLLVTQVNTQKVSGSKLLVTRYNRYQPIHQKTLRGGATSS